MNIFKSDNVLQVARKVVVWCITDGKRGHVNQIRALTTALGREMAIQVIEFQASPGWRSCLRYAMRIFPAGVLQPAPDLIVGAGHATHLDMLAAKRAFGGKTVILMKPTLPRSLFDLCLIPQHDGVTPSRDVITTLGPLSLVTPSAAKMDGHGLILLGGLSKHYQWQDDVLLDALQHLLADMPHMRWTLATSPRTPDSMLALLRQAMLTNLDIVPFDRVPANWLPSRLASAEQIWVTPDSVSMVYEALTAGARVGVFDLPVRRRSRVVVGLEKLELMGWVTRFQSWRQGSGLPSPVTRLDEAARCASWIKRRWAFAN